METALLRARLFLTDRYLPARDRVKCAIPALHAVHEDSNATPFLQQAERFLQVLWNERCGGAELRTRNGAPITVRSSGTWNSAAGPDFRGARLLVDGRSVRGDVEIHRREADWFAHGHHRDPAYRNVCLHVVALSSGQPAHSDTGTVPPCLVLADCVGDAIREATLQAAAEYPYAQQVPPGRCALQSMHWEDVDIQTWLEAAGLSRFREKTRRLLATIQERGPDQAVYQHLFDALGYRANRGPFRELARTVPLSRLRKGAAPTDCAALLFGTAGLLPDPSRPSMHPEERRTLRHLWDSWWQHGCAPLRTRWTWSGVRPPNRPDRRLAAGVSLLLDTQFCPGTKLLDAARACTDGSELLHRLDQFLTVTPPARAPWLAAIAPDRANRLLGRSRIHDISINVALPYLAAEAVRDEDEVLLRVAESAFLRMPRLQSNRPLQEVEHRLFLPPSRARTVVRRACHQQGLLAIHRDFCLALGTDCLRCPLAHQLRAPTPPAATGTPTATNETPEPRLHPCNPA